MGQKYYYARARAATLASFVIAIFATAYADTNFYEYDGVLPEVSGNEFTSTSIPTWVTDPAQWTGTVSIKNVTVTDFTVNPYGNESSVVCLSNVTGWLRAPGNYAFTNSVPVEVTGTLTINNGNSVAFDDNLKDQSRRCALFKKLSGNGTIRTTGDGVNAAIVIQDASGFTGSLSVENKIIVFGEKLPLFDTANLTNSIIFVTEGASVTNNTGFWWAYNGIKVDGELCAPDHATYFGGGTTITTSDTGVFTLLTTTKNIDDLNVNYTRITGTGTLKYEGGFYRTISTNHFPTAMTVENNLSTGGLIHRVPNIELTIGSLSGNGRMRSDWSGTGSIGDRDLRILQAKDTTYSGLFDKDLDRIKTIKVASGTSSAGTLTLSGTQTANNDLVVESGAKVNLTGTWVGPVTVVGTLGGTGTITGNLTLSDGATLNVVDVNNPLKVSGNFSATGTIEVHLPAGTDLSHLKTVLSATGTINAGSATFLVTERGGEDQNPAHYSVKTGKNRLFVTGNHGHRVIFR